MTRAELLAETRYLVGDTTGPLYAWSDERLLNWLSEGQDKFCEQSGYWSDKSTYTITTVLDQKDYAIPDRIIAVRSVWDSTRRLVEFTDDARLAEGEGFSDLTAQSPQFYQLDAETGVISLREPPTAGIVLSLRAHRRSKVRLSDPTGAPELPAEFHLALCEYAAYKAFGDHDRELQDPVKAADHYANFKLYVRDGKRSYRRLTGEYVDVVPAPLYVV